MSECAVYRCALTSFAWVSDWKTFGQGIGLYIFFVWALLLAGWLAGCWARLVCSTLAIWLNYFFGFSSSSRSAIWDGDQTPTFFFVSLYVLLCVYLIRLVMWWASFSYLCLQGTSFGELEKTRAPTRIQVQTYIQNCSTMEYHRWLVDDFFPFRCGPGHTTTTNKISCENRTTNGVGKCDFLGVFLHFFLWTVLSALWRLHT